jgi:hypothetical protein
LTNVGIKIEENDQLTKNKLAILPRLVAEDGQHLS